MGAAPLRARDALNSYWSEWAADGPEAWERWLPRIAEIADGIGAIVGAPAGSCFLGPNVSVLQAALATCIDFRGERNEILYESLQFPSLTYVWREWERYGAAVAGRSLRRRPDDSNRAHRCRDHRENGARRALARVLRFRRGRRRSRDPGALPQRRRAALRRCLSDDRHLSVRRDAVGSRRRDRRLAQVALRRPGLRLDLRKALAAGAIPSGGHRLDGARRDRSTSNPRRSSTRPPCSVSVTARRRYPDIWSRGPGTDRGVDRRRANPRTQRRPHDSGSRATALERGLRVNSPLEPQRRTGWIGIDFEGAERACRELALRRVFMDTGPAAGSASARTSTPPTTRSTDFSTSLNPCGGSLVSS